jgi:diaminopimelate decarboxylase
MQTTDLGPQYAELASRYGTPLWLYDAQVIRDRVAECKGFDRIRYAQKANPNLAILRLLRSLGATVDAVSSGELARAKAAGFQLHADAHDVVYTADILARDALSLVVQHRVAVNCGSIDMLDQLGEVSAGHPVWLRINPGFGHGHSKKTATGGESSKHGIWFEQLRSAKTAIERNRHQLVGLHIHIGSGADEEHLVAACDAMVHAVRVLDIPVSAISAGGGMRVPYEVGELNADMRRLCASWTAAVEDIAQFTGHRPVLEVEPGRFLVAQAGVLIAEVRAVKFSGAQRFCLVDASMADLLRPALYGSYHRLTLLGSEGESTEHRPWSSVVVGGCLCESGDVFFQDAAGTLLPRDMPEPRVGDWVVIHDVGAYGSAMSSNYNSRPLAAELILNKGKVQIARHRQPLDDLLRLETTH